VFVASTVGGLFTGVIAISLVGVFESAPPSLTLNWIVFDVTGERFAVANLTDWSVVW
jgi:hypothetical protein